MWTIDDRFLRFAEMKNILFYTLITATFFSCTKSDTPTPPPAEDSLVKSYTLYYPQLHTKLVEYFSYDQNAKIASISGHTYDSTSGVSDDSAHINFSSSDANALPNSLYVTDFYQGAPATGYTDHHLLYYDNNNRLIKDSITESDVQDSSVQKLYYDDLGNYTVEYYEPDPNAPGGPFVLLQNDTTMVQSANIFNEINYSYNQGSQTFNYLKNQTSGVQINPLYNDKLSTAYGSFFLFNEVGDFLSKNLPTQTTDQEGIGSEQVVLNYTWTTTTNGKVIQGLATDISGTAQMIYTYTY
jgi:hypothetical protein